MKSSIAKIIAFVKLHRDRLWRGFIFALVAWSGYNMGIIAAREGIKPAQEAALFQARTGIVSQTPQGVGQGSATSRKSTHTDDPRVVVSKSSKSMKYHHPWCAGATQIKEANRLWFDSATAAQQAGYTLAGNCAE